MTHHLKLIFITLLTALLPVCAGGQGLKFIGMERSIEERTSYDVFGSKIKTFSDAYEISFQMMLYPQSDFGYILRVKDKDDHSKVWNMSYDGKGDDVEIRINEEARYSIICERISRDRLDYHQWYDISLKIDLQRDSVYLAIGDLKFRAHAKSELPHSVTPVLTFGMSDHIIDVPSFAIRNLTVRECRYGGKEFRFPLDAGEGNVVDDEEFRIKGRVRNPVWLVGESMTWKHELTLNSRQVASVGYDVFSKELYMVNRDSLYTYGLRTDRIVREKMESPCPVVMKLGCSYVSPADSSLYVYELFEESTVDTPTVARYERDSGEWVPLSYSKMDMCMHHHATFFLPGSDMFCFFGGFGHLLYNGIFYGFNDKENVWKEMWGDEMSSGGGSRIFPRYFASAGMSRDGRYLYVFGGMGNECGEQIVGRKYFYDLHKVDVQTGRTECLWELDWQGEHIVPVRNMYVGEGEFYVMCYPEYKTHSELKLYRFSIADGSYEILGNEIPINSDKITTNANMYYDDDLKKMFVTVQEFADDVRSELKVYSLAFPPVVEAESAWELWGKRHHGMLLAGLVCLSFAVLCLALLWVRRMKPGEDSRTAGRKSRCFMPEGHRNSIQLFGDFKVIDPEGKDISHLFTGQQQTILFLLMKRYNENGMSSKRLSSILWPDKDEDKVKNSRGVAINNLRKSLGMLDGITLTFNEGRYRLEVEDSLWCDYLQLLPVLEGRSIDPKDIDKALCILSGNGKFLSLVTDPVFDTFKAKVENGVLELLHNEIAKRFDARDYGAVTEIADMLASVDSLDEAALRYSVQALKKMRKNEDAKVRYAAFASEYRALYDSEYSVPYNKI